MGTQVSWQVELAVKPGALEDFRKLTVEMVEATQHEPGVVHYERFMSQDGTIVHVYERYMDSAAAVAHLRLFRHKFGARFANLVDRMRFTVYGTPSQELRQMLDGFGATYLEPFGGQSVE